MTKDRLELMKELAAVRDRNQKLDETVQLLRQQAEIYQVRIIIGIEIVTNSFYFRNKWVNFRRVQETPLNLLTFSNLKLKN